MKIPRASISFRGDVSQLLRRLRGGDPLLLDSAAISTLIANEIKTTMILSISTLTLLALSLSAASAVKTRQRIISSKHKSSHGQVSDSPAIEKAFCAMLAKLRDYLLGRSRVQCFLAIEGHQSLKYYRTPSGQP